MKLTFCGGARSVTGANYLLEVNGNQYLFECGLTQGNKFADEQNYQAFPYDPKNIKAVFITHAHIDHIGLLPRLIKEGYEGKIYSTIPTTDLAIPMLEDALGLLEEENRSSGGEMLYEEKDLRKCLNMFSGLEYNKETEIDDNVKVCFYDAGHVLGSAIIKVSAKEGRKKRTIVFSGDLGNPPTPLLRPTEYIKGADYILIESTYGDRIHEDRELRKELFEDAIEETITNKGVLMVPAFALERTQELLFELNELVENKRIPFVPIFIDSPLAIRLTDIYKKYSRYYNNEAKNLLLHGDQIFSFSGLKFTETPAESRMINDVPPPKVIIAGSGMSNGGRILHHERRYLSDPKSLLLIISYQTAGSPGRRILEGEKLIKIFDKPVQVMCKIRAIGGYSAHPDKKGLMKWLERFDTHKIRKIFIIQGEEGPALALLNQVRDNLGIEAMVPYKGDAVELD
ncbi:MAG: MBL fold metallo-hydrolase [Candidatus Paceibacterota bacterium]|jgi:metallo-beta-lactamase family protein